MTKRRSEGNETWFRLLDWTRAPAASERLASHLLRFEGYSSIDPSHPLGGKDGLKDLVCTREGRRWIGAAYFPRGQQSLSDIRAKFEHDLEGVRANEADGIAFVTNQELRLAERRELGELAGTIASDLFHLERISSILDSPGCYGLRLEYLDMEMTKEEQLDFFATITQGTVDVHNQLARIAEALADPGLEASIPTKELAEFRDLLHSLVGPPGGWSLLAPIGRLRPPTYELQQYADLLFNLTGGLSSIAFSAVDRLRPPTYELQQYAELLERLVGPPDTISVFSPMNRLRPPIHELSEYERTLDSVIEKLRLKRALES